MKKKIVIASTIIILIVISVYYALFLNREKNHYEEANKTVRKFIVAENKKDMKTIDELILKSEETQYTIGSSIPKMINEINSIEYKSSTPAKSKYEPLECTVNGFKKTFKEGIILEVDYYIDYKKDNQPDSDGLNSMFYTLVKDGDVYKIASIGTGP